jgi:hypothetical protein
MLMMIDDMERHHRHHHHHGRVTRVHMSQLKTTTHNETKKVLAVLAARL